EVARLEVDLAEPERPQPARQALTVQADRCSFHHECVEVPPIEHRPDRNEIDLDSCNEREALPHLAVDLRGPTGQSTAVGFSGLRCEYSKTVYVRDSRDGQVPSYGAAHVDTVHVRPPLAQIPVHEMV